MSEQKSPTKTISDFEAKLSEADKNVAAFDTSKLGVLFRIRSFLRDNPTSIPAFILLLSIVGFALNALFFNPNNFISTAVANAILVQVTVVGIAAIAQTLIILTAGIDLSIAPILVISSMIMGKLGTESGVPVWICVPLGIFLAGLMGWVNGALIAYVKIPPFITTLGTLNIFVALKLWYTDAQSVRPNDLEEKAPGLLDFGNSLNIGFKDGFHITYSTAAKIVPPLPGDITILLGTVVMLLLAALAWYMLYRTPWGRHVHAIGDDPDAAMLSGIQVSRTLVSVYAVAGLIIGVGAWVSIGRVGSISPIAFETIALDTITAVVIGGTSLFGGRASIAGSVLGALIVGVFTTGLQVAGVDSFWQYFAAGNLILAAVALDQWLRKASQ